MKLSTQLRVGVPCSSRLLQGNATWPPGHRKGTSCPSASAASAARHRHRGCGGRRSCSSRASGPAGPTSRRATPATCRWPRGRSRWSSPTRRTPARSSCPTPTSPPATSKVGQLHREEHRQHPGSREDRRAVRQRPGQPRQRQPEQADGGGRQLPGDHAGDVDADQRRPRRAEPGPVADLHRPRRPRPVRRQRVAEPLGVDRRHGHPQAAVIPSGTDRVTVRWPLSPFGMRAAATRQNLLMLEGMNVGL